MEIYSLDPEDDSLKFTIPRKTSDESTYDSSAIGGFPFSVRVQEWRLSPQKLLSLLLMLSMLPQMYGNGVHLETLPTSTLPSNEALPVATALPDASLSLLLKPAVCNWRMSRMLSHKH